MRKNKGIRKAAKAPADEEEKKKRKKKNKHFAQKVQERQSQTVTISTAVSNGRKTDKGRGPSRPKPFSRTSAPSSKEEMVQRIAKEAKLSSTQANKALSAFFDGITSSLKKGRKTSFVGFGTFSVARRKARMGRNPQTGARIRIAACKVPKFKPGKGLSSAVK